MPFIYLKKLYSDFITLTCSAEHNVNAERALGLPFLIVVVNILSYYEIRVNGRTPRNGTELWINLTLYVNLSNVLGPWLCRIGNRDIGTESIDSVPLKFQSSGPYFAGTV